jgi:outer membrane lipoprotein-sorting protein
MKRIVLFFTLGLLSVSLFAQQDPQAKAALEKAVAVIKSSPVKLSFSTVVESPSSKKKQYLSGTLLLMGNKFKLLMNGAESYFDGKTQWVYVPENNEVTVSTISAKEQQHVNPLSVLSQYNGKDTKIVFDAETSAGSQSIDIYPTARNANEFRILIKLDKRTNSPQSIQLFSRDGTRTAVTVKSFQRVTSDAKTFTFDAKAHPKVTVNDLR